MSKYFMISEDALNSIRDALGTGRIVAQDENGNYTREVTPKVIVEAIAEVDKVLNPKLFENRFWKSNPNKVIDQDDIRQRIE